MHSHTVNIHEAKTHFSKLIQAVLDGDEVIIAKAGHPMVKIVPVETKKKKIIYGGLKGKIHIPPEFYEPLPDDILAYFEGRGEDNETSN